MRRTSEHSAGSTSVTEAESDAVDVFASDSRSSRKLLLRRVVLATGTIGFGTGIGLGSLEAAEASGRSRQETRILNFLLLLEQIQQAFYERAVAANALADELDGFARTAAAQDRAHADRLGSMLGRSARAKPELRFGDAVNADAKFVRAAITLKEAAVAAYIGQGANLPVSRVTPIASIVSVEARHAAWLRAIAGDLPAPRAADQSETPKEVMTTIQRTGFVSQS
jgi:hypothetical protein